MRKQELRLLQQQREVAATESLSPNMIRRMAKEQATATHQKQAMAAKEEAREKSTPKDRRKDKHTRKKAKMVEQPEGPQVGPVAEHAADVQALSIAWPLFPERPRPSHVRQGCLNNCYFVCALQAIAQHRPDAIRSAITALGDSAFKVRLFTKYGHKCEYVLNKTFWCDVKSVFHTDKKPYLMYMSSPAEALWPPLLEKAFALHVAEQWSYFPNYQGIEGVFNVSDVVVALVDGYDDLYWNEHMMPPDNLWLSDMFRSLKEAIHRGHFVCTGTDAADADFDDGAVGGGLYANHMYIVTQAHCVDGIEYLLLRNVHNRSESSIQKAFTSETVDSLLRTKTLQKTHAAKEEDAEFRITMDTFLKCFRSYEIGEFKESTFSERFTN